MLIKFNPSSYAFLNAQSTQQTPAINKKSPQLSETAADPTKSAISPGRAIQMAYHVPPLLSPSRMRKKNNHCLCLHNEKLKRENRVSPPMEMQIQPKNLKIPWRGQKKSQIPELLAHQPFVIRTTHQIHDSGLTLQTSCSIPQKQSPQTPPPRYINHN